jgi:signal transduction histidine kinase
MDLSKYTVLFIDDESEILKALQRELRTEPYHCDFLNDPRQAIERIMTLSPAVVVSDMRMPEMSGAELLAEIRGSRPDVIGMILSGWSDVGGILDAVNQGHVFRYILKPWDQRDLKIAVRQALEFYELQSEKRELCKRLEEQNRLLEERVEKRTAEVLKMRSPAEIGKYASQIVHNLNNPLQALKGTLGVAELLLWNTDDIKPEKLKEIIGLANRAADDIKNIVVSILQHARDEHYFHYEPVDINKVIGDEIVFFNLNPFFRNKVKKELHLSPNLPHLMGSSVQIKQIVDNIVGNAIDAMENSRNRTLSIRTALEDWSISIVIEDTGEGISPNDLEKIFSPDYSTKPTGKGTGLGLASVKAMVQAYSGQVEVQSKKDQGTQFTIKLPLQRAPYNGSDIKRPCQPI